MSVQRERRRLLIAVSLVLVLVLAGCTGQQTSEQQEEEWKIGFMGPFTGVASHFGGMMDRGLKFAMSELPNETRSKIEIVRVDTKGDSKSALKAAQKLVNIDNVDYVIGPLTNEATIPTEDLFEREKVITMTTGLPSSDIADMGPYYYTLSPEIKNLMERVAGEMRKEGYENVATIRMDATFEHENYIHFKRYFEEGGGQIVSDQAIPRGNSDFRTPITKIKEAEPEPEALFIAAHTEELINILRQLEEQGLGDIPKYGIHAVEAPVILKQAPELADGLVYPYPSSSRESKTAQEYTKKYTSRYDMRPDPYSQNTYDSLNLLVKAFKKCGYDNKECVQNELDSIENYKSSRGLLSVDDRGIGQFKKIQLKVVRDGEFKELQE